MYVYKFICFRWNFAMKLYSSNVSLGSRHNAINLSQVPVCSRHNEWIFITHRALNLSKFLHKISPITCKKTLSARHQGDICLQLFHSPLYSHKHEHIHWFLKQFCYKSTFLQLCHIVCIYLLSTCQSFTSMHHLPCWQ